MTTTPTTGSHELSFTYGDCFGGRYSSHVRCTCGADFEAHGLNLDAVEDEVTSLLAAHIRAAR